MSKAQIIKIKPSDLDELIIITLTGTEGSGKITVLRECVAIVNESSIGSNHEMSF